MISIEEKIARLRLLNTPKIGYVTFKFLLNKFKTAKNAIENYDNFCTSLGKKEKHLIPNASIYENYLNECAKKNVQLVFFDDEKYPKRLLEIADYPPLLHCIGNINLFQNTHLAIIGSRNASIQGLAFTKRIAASLSNHFKIISGFARGIDAVAHEASLKSGTIGVLGCCASVIYPEENKDLYYKILNSNGLFVSESMLNQEPRPNLFSYRNRIIAGISSGILVIEATKNSGSLVTAKYALEQGRDIFAVPGHPNDFRSSGVNYLIKNGAYLVETEDDIINQFNHSYNQTNLFEGQVQVMEEENLDMIEEEIFEKLTQNPVSINEIIRFSNFSVSSVHSALAILELKSKIEIKDGMVSKI